MIACGEFRDALILTRPRQWPILSFQLAVGIGLAFGSGAEYSALNPLPVSLLLAGAWLAWVFLLNGCTLAFNSAYDQDTEAVAYLASPPVPPSWLHQAALTGMATGSLVGWLIIGPAFGLLTAVCAALSVCYSHPRLRWKAVPGLDLLVNMVGYGAGTTLAGLLAGQAVLSTKTVWTRQLELALGHGGTWFVVGFAALFGSFYPLTQLYQMQADRQRGDRTLAVALGLRPSLVLAVVLGLLAGTCFQAGLFAAGRTDWILLPGVACLLWLLHLARWWQVAPDMKDREHARGMYRSLALWAGIDVALLLAWWL